MAVETLTRSISRQMVTSFYQGTVCGELAVVQLLFRSSFAYTAGAAWSPKRLGPTILVPASKRLRCIFPKWSLSVLVCHTLQLLKKQQVQDLLLSPTGWQVPRALVSQWTLRSPQKTQTALARRWSNTSFNFPFLSVLKGEWACKKRRQGFTKIVDFYAFFFFYFIR